MHQPRTHRFSDLVYSKSPASFVAMALTLLATLAFAAKNPSDLQTLEIGDSAPEFTLPGIDGRDWSLSDFKSKVFVVYFTSNHCPICHAHDPRFVALVKELAGQSVDIVAINPNSGDGLRPEELGYSQYDDSFEDMTPYAKDEGFTFPYLYDGETQSTAKAYGCLATPHMFVFDQDRKLQYKGHFDDSRFADPATVKHQRGRDAIMSVLEDKPVAVATTKPFGCSTKWLEKRGTVKEAHEAWLSADIKLDDIDAAGIRKLVKNDTEKFRLFNVWSTTCAPCVEEFPGLSNVARRMGMRKFDLITISTDLPESRKQVEAFLSKHRMVLPKRLKESVENEGRTTNNYLYTEASMESLIEALDAEWEGPQPHTVLVAPGGEIVFRHNGMIEEEALLKTVLDRMSTTYQPK